VKFVVNPGITGENIKVRSVMKKLSLVLLLWLSAFCLVFGQVSSARKSLFNEANNTIGKRVPSSWKENDGLYWKSLNIAVGKEYSVVQVKWLEE